MSTCPSHVDVNIEINNDSSLGADITNYKTSGAYTKRPDYIATEGAKVEICVSLEILLWVIELYIPLSLSRLTAVTPTTL